MGSDRSRLGLLFAQLLSAVAQAIDDDAQLRPWRFVLSPKSGQCVQGRRSGGEGFQGLSAVHRSGLVKMM